MRKLLASAAGALVLAGLAVTSANATIVNFDDVTLANPSPSVNTYPDAFQGPIGFVDQGYQFSDNIVIANINNIANGPAYSGSNAAFNDYDGYGFGPDFDITKVGGGTFSFAGVEIQSWSYSSHSDQVPGSGEVQGNIFGYDNGTLVGIQTYSNVLGWTSVGTTGAIGSFASITELVIDPITGNNNQNTLTLIDNLEVNSVSAAVPESSTWTMLLIGFAVLGFAGPATRRLNLLA